MSDRDWRIFREDFNITIKGGRVPRPMRNWEEMNLPKDIYDIIMEVGYKVGYHLFIFLTSGVNGITQICKPECTKVRYGILTTGPISHNPQQHFIMLLSVFSSNHIMAIG